MGDFNSATRQAKLTLSPISFVDSNVSSIDLPQVGYLGAINVLVKGTVTTASASSATQITYPYHPMGIVRRIVLRTNEGADIFNTSGWGCYLYDSIIRTGFDPVTNHSDLFSTGSDPFSQYFVQTGTLGASVTAQPFRFMLRLPISWGDMNLTGLLLLQNPGVRFTLEITWGTTTDLYSATTGTVTLASITATPQIEIYHLPADPNDDPDLMFAKTVLEDRKDITAVGDVVYNPILGNTINRVIQEFVQGTSGGQNSAFNSSDLTAVKIAYAQSQVVYNINSDIHLYDQRRWYNRDLPSGVLVHDFTMGNGLPELPSGRDTFDTSKITDMSITTSLRAAMSLTSGAFLRTIREQLVTVRS